MALCRLNSFRRAIPSRRTLASSPHSFPDVKNAGADKHNQLTKLMKDIVNESESTSPQGFVTAEPETERKPKVLAFSETGVVRPIDLNRDMATRRTFRGRPSLGPGREARYNDVFLQLGIDPRREADNEKLMSAYMTRLGRIQPRSVTGLSQRSQRLLGKAIKRAKMMGIVPILSNSIFRELSAGSIQNSEEDVGPPEEEEGEMVDAEEANGTEKVRTQKDSTPTRTIAE